MSKRKKEEDEEIEMSNFFVDRSITTQFGLHPQVFHVPVNWIPKGRKGSLVDKDELIDMGEEFSTEYCNLKNQIYLANKRLKEMDQEVIERSKNQIKD